MLEKIDLSRKLNKKEFQKTIEQLDMKLADLQRQCKRVGLPVMVIFEGFGAAGKGTLINRLIENLDPRGFRVFSIQGESEEEKRHPFLWRFWTKTPAKGRMHIFDRSWYRKVLVERFDGITTEEELSYVYDEINSFEKQLTDDGTLILKLFLYIDQKEQKKRFQKLMDNKETAWRVTKDDLKRNKHYDSYLRMNEEMLEKTDTEQAPWYIIESMDREFATVKILSIVIERLEEALKRSEEQKKPAEPSVKESEIIPSLRSSVLQNVDLTKSLTKEEYKKKLSQLQGKLSLLHSELYRRKIPVILAFEGWDAGGKGGAIKRLTQAMDPRGYEVIPTAAPNDIEKVHHYLWRFWQNVPKAGHVALFDRTWYGRVMVERIEGFCSQEEWQRAYKEINDMESNISNFGTVILKFWMHIDQEEQEKRFQLRMETPEKQWKITEEDWRNREKWGLYEEAVEEMLIRTSTTYAPWVIVEANSKYYARIKVLETVVATLEERLKQSD